MNDARRAAIVAAVAALFGALTFGCECGSEPRLLWALTAGGPASDRACSVAVIDDKRSVVASLAGIATFGDETLGVEPDANPGGFGNNLATLSLRPDGAIDDVRIVSGASARVVSAFTVQSARSTYVVSAFTGIAEISGESFGAEDRVTLLVERLAGGAVAWSRAFTVETPDLPPELALLVRPTAVAEHRGAVIIAGLLAGTVDFGAERLTVEEGAGSRPFLLELSEDGVVSFARLFDAECSATCVVVTSIATVEGAVLLLGSFDSPGTIGFGGAPITRGLDDGDVSFVVELDEVGAFSWSLRLPGTTRPPFPSPSTCCGLQADAEAIFVALEFSGDVSVSDDIALESNGGTDFFIGRISRAGAVEWARGLGGTEDDDAPGIVVSAVDTLLVAGALSTTTAFDDVKLESTNEGETFLLQVRASDGSVTSGSVLTRGASIRQITSSDASGGVLVVGDFGGTADILGFSIESTGETDLVIAEVVP